MDEVGAKAGAALGARLRRLSERLDTDAARVYAAQGVEFEQRWFGVLNQLALKGPMSVGALAEALGITHVSVSQTRVSLERAGLIWQEPDASDARRRLLSLSTSGKAFAARLAPLWAAFEQASLALDTEAGGLSAALDRLEVALARRSLFDRITAAAEPRGNR
ncbi:MarR family protein [Stigmatella aurantiaca]|uniref:MarR family protein n=1 Tax=Stigmatella aurantiaca TaxID=41 RepID=A0A1H7Z131_STIAU|nr:MarR family transcriptional regulator [Stigmatella aurantiaca]SEM51704.1 MarR family protein [Stigmatella aurantiaca]